MSIFNFNLFGQLSQLIKPNNYKQGFLLIEVSIAFLIISIFTACAATWYSTLIDTQLNAQSKSQAIMYASNLLEYIRIFKKIPNVKKYKNFDVIFNIESTDLKNFKIIKVSLFWIQNAQNKKIELSTGAVIYD